MLDENLIIGEPVKVARAYEQLAEVLRERIRGGVLQPGDRLPSETSLAQQAGVSRSTVREALRTLQEAGLIERASPKIMIVRRQSDDPVHRELTAALRRRNVTFHHLHEALLVIEPELTRIATERAEEADIRLLRQNLDHQQRNLENFPEWCRLDEEFHLAIAEMSANPALIITRTPITQLLLPVLNRFIRSSTLTIHALRYHHRILFEVEARDRRAGCRGRPAAHQRLPHRVGEGRARLRHGDRRPRQRLLPAARPRHGWRRRRGAAVGLPSQGQFVL